MHYRPVSSIPGLYALVAGSTPKLRQPKNVSRHCKHPYGARLPPPRTLFLEDSFPSHDWKPLFLGARSGFAFELPGHIFGAPLSSLCSPDAAVPQRLDPIPFPITFYAFSFSSVPRILNIVYLPHTLTVVLSPDLSPKLRTHCGLFYMSRGPHRIHLSFSRNPFRFSPHLSYRPSPAS